MHDILKACPIVVTNNTPEFYVTPALFLMEKGNFKRKISNPRGIQVVKFLSRCLFKMSAS
jgi:hypothetical protein